MANTNPKTPRFRRSVNEPLKEENFPTHISRCLGIS